MTARNTQVDPGIVDDAGCRIMAVLPELTPKQHEVLFFVAENRTSKEIAWELKISESAVNQRIEGVRARTGAPPRNELARVYRQYLADVEAACNPIPADNIQVPASSDLGLSPSQDNEAVSEMSASGQEVTSARMQEVATGSSDHGSGRIVPEVLDGPARGLNRTAAMIAIALGMLLVAIVGLAVARSLSDLI